MRRGTGEGILSSALSRPRTRTDDLPDGEGPLVAAKLGLYRAMRDQGVTPGILAERLGLGEAAVRRLLDLGRPTPLGKVEAALAALGKRLTVSVDDAA